jgi:serine/threonine-protein kinase
MLFKGQTLGKYRILSPLGSGGFGTVYLARDTWLDKQVAIKVPHRQGLDFSELLREPRLLASVNHPNIVAITTADKQDDVFFIVMEYVAGETLESVLEREGALDLPRALDYTVQIGNAVDHAHKQGVIHRDLRPANVLVSENGMLKVADFGTSRFLEIAAHGTTVIGSPAFMAPEQFQGKAVFASDLYSVGITMYQMLTGELPYEPPPPSGLHKLLTGELVSPPRTRNPAIPRRLNDIVMKALAPQVTDRYTRASDLLDDLLAAKSVILGTPGPRAMADLGLDEAHRQARPTVPPLPRAVKYQDREAARNCWHCRRPLHNLASKCPFCGENQ